MAARRGLLLVAGGCLGLPVLALVLLAVTYVGCTYLGSRPAVASVREMLAEIRRGEVEEAYRRMDGSYRAMNDLDDFKAFLAQHPALADNASSSFWNREYSIDAGNTKLENAVLVSRSGVEERFTFRVAATGGISIEVPTGAGP